MVRISAPGHQAKVLRSLDGSALLAARSSNSRSPKVSSLCKPYLTVGFGLRDNGVTVEPKLALPTVDEVVDQGYSVIIIDGQIPIGSHTLVERCELLKRWIFDLRKAIHTHGDGRPLTLLGSSPESYDFMHSVAMAGVYVLPNTSFSGHQMLDEICGIIDAPPKTFRYFLMNKWRHAYRDREEREAKARASAGECYGHNKGRRLLWNPDQSGGRIG